MGVGKFHWRLQWLHLFSSLLMLPGTLKLTALRTWKWMDGTGSELNHSCSDRCTVVRYTVPVPWILPGSSLEFPPLNSGAKKSCLAPTPRPSATGTSSAPQRCRSTSLVGLVSFDHLGGVLRRIYPLNIGIYNKYPKNHGISKLVVWRSQTSAIHIQNPL